MSKGSELGAVVLLRTTRSTRNLARVFGAVAGVSRVDRVRGPYNFVIHTEHPVQIDVIERLPGVVTAEVCWLSSRS